MRFLADVNIDMRVVAWLRESGHEATHLREEGLHRMADADIFARAAVEDRIVLTFDLDFADIAAATSGKATSVILLRLQNTRTAFVLRRLATVLESSRLPLEHGAVVVVEDARLRFRYLPIGTERGE